MRQNRGLSYTPAKMNCTSQTSYTHLPKSIVSYEANGAYHSAMRTAAIVRLIPVLRNHFSNISNTKLRFLELLLHRVFRCDYSLTAHSVIFMTFGKPCFLLRNLAYVLQPTADRKVFVVHLENAMYTMYTETNGLSDGLTNWCASILLAGVILFGIGITVMLPLPSVPYNPSPWHSFLN